MEEDILTVGDESGTATDTVTLNIIHNALTNIAAEMALVMLKTSYSTIFNEGLDFTTVLLDQHGDLIAEKNYTPSMMGAIPHTVKWAVEEKGIEHFHPGDVVVHNDCYRGGCHLPEHMMMQPIFVGEQLFGFAGNIGHVAEIGGKAPGSFAADATDIYQEGLRLPPVKLIDRGEYVEDVWRIVLANHRTPHNTWGDFHAMIGVAGDSRAAHSRAGRALRRSAHRASDRRADGLLRASPARRDPRATGWRVLRPACWSRTTASRPIRSRSRSRIVIHGDEIIADFTGSSPQVRGPMNCTVVVVASAVYNAVFSITDPHTSIPRNSGCYRPVKFIAPAGSVVNVVHPGPCVGGNTDLQPKLIDLLLEAFSQAVPERVAAASGGSSSNFLFGGIHPETGTYYTNYHFDGHGTGGTIAEGRQRRRDHPALELPQHAGRGLRGALPLPQSRVSAHARLRWTRRASRRAGDDAHPGGHRRRDHPELSLRPRQDPGWGLFGGKSGGLSQLDSQARRRRSVPHVRRGLPHRLAHEVHERPAQAAATSSAT